LAASTTKPIIGVPMKGGAMDGMDAMLSTVQMPAGMPVATVALGKAGAVNAAYLAMQILAISDKEQLLQKLEEDYQKSKATLHEISEDKLNERWQMKMGEQVLADWDKYGAIRHSLNQATHHRAQLGVYYRLLDIPVPGSYGPSADEQEM
jgi:hypothetical protein